MKSIFPVSLRLDGTLNDLRQIAGMPQYPLDDISAPALVIHGDSDSIVPFSQGQYSASAIPNAQLLIVKDGDHFSFLTHSEITNPAIIEFLKSHAP
jgi:pimeloyl-ACP methyl ester carboxylesterase